MNEWAARLRAELAAFPHGAPSPGAPAGGSEGAWRKGILEGSVRDWLQCHGPQLLKERRALDPGVGADPDPALVFTSDPEGLAAAEEVLREEGKVIPMSEEEYREWVVRNPDPGYLRHVRFWSFFHGRVPPAILERARREHPLPEGAVYWVQSEGTLWGPSMGRGVTHLLSWDGTEARLLEEAVERWVL